MKVRAPTYTDDELAYLTRYNLDIQLYWYAGILSMIVAFGVLNWTSRILSAAFIRRFNSLHPAKASGRSYFSGAVAVYRKWAYRRNQVVVFLGFGSAAQFFVFLSYSAITLSLVFSGTLGKGWADYSAHHAARLTYAHLPVLVGLASKDLGVISWLTGFSPATLNAFHRWMARMTFFLACWHVFGRFYVNLPTIAPSRRGLVYQAWGIGALTLWTIMVFGSGRIIRRRFFKSFFYSHVVCFALSVICCALHIPRLGPYLIAAAVIYMADRLVRLANSIYWMAFRTVSHGVGPSARVEVISKDAIKIFVKTAQKWSPGSHVYLHCPTFEAGGHPFSVASNYLPVSHLDNDPPPKNATMVLAIRVHTGLTAKLYQHVLEGTEALAYASSDAKNLSMPLFPAFTEGPYGHRFLVHHYESVLLFTGGSGVTFAMPHMLDLVRRARNKQLGGRKPLITNRVTFVWAVKTAVEVGMMDDELREAIALAPPGFLDVQIYVTSGDTGSNPSLVNELDYTQSIDSHYKGGGGGSSEYGEYGVASRVQVGSGVSQETLRSDLRAPSTIDIRFPPPPRTPATAPPSLTSREPALHPSSLMPGRRNSEDLTGATSTTVGADSVVLPILPGRPRVRDILADVVARTPFSGSVAVGVCGPVQLADDVGAACSDTIDVGKIVRGEHRLNVMLHQEVFGW
ncbi:hypothetical protein JCM6882_003496 [Rhodosporidiobolus microsporus]